jgi:hypothetical protein
MSQPFSIKIKGLTDPASRIAAQGDVTMPSLLRPRMGGIMESRKGICNEQKLPVRQF